MLQILTKIKNTFRYYKSIQELTRLSDRELADIGLTRGQIPFVVYNNEFKKNV